MPVLEISADGVVTLPRSSNQARGLAEFAQAFLRSGGCQPSAAVLDRLELFHLDSLACGVSALGLGANAPCVLRNEALEYATQRGVCCYGSRTQVQPEKAVLANCAAVREWDSNGTNFGFNPARGHVCGEFGHNDFYPVALAGAQLAGADGRTLLRAMLLLDEIRGRLAEVFSLKSHKIDHVVHGAIASAVVYGALTGASIDEVESALGLLVAHYIPFRAIRAGEQLSDSKGASAAISAEAAVASVRRARRGFVGPADIFRNPQAIFCLYSPGMPRGESPFDLLLSTRGDDFAIAGMHFKLGLYEHQSAGAIQGLLDLLARHPQLLAREKSLEQIEIVIYEPAFSIIADPAKRDPQTRQSADHSLPYIVSRVLAKALATQQSGWRELMLLPEDYSQSSLHDPLTRRLMQRVALRHGGPEYDRRYPDGIPTSVVITHAEIGRLDSGLVMYPLGHARNSSAELLSVLEHKLHVLAAQGVDDVPELLRRFRGLEEKSAAEVADLCAFPLRTGARAIE